MAKRMYTEKIHAKRLIKILESGDTCHKCPGSEHFGSDEQTDVLWKNDPCDYCGKFIDGTLRRCPCSEFGAEYAAKRSWIALEEKGYI